MNYGDALVDTFYNSFSSQQQQHYGGGMRSARTAAAASSHNNSFFDEVELLKVTATRSDLERFNRNVLKLKTKWDLDISASLVVPRSEELKQRLEEQSNNNNNNGSGDLLDMVFGNNNAKLPGMLHDWMMTGEVETQFVRVEGSHHVVDAFNRLVEQMLYDKNMAKAVTIRLVERRKIIVDNNIAMIQEVPSSMTDVDALLDSIFTLDFSKSAPWLHAALVA